MLNGLRISGSNGTVSMTFFLIWNLSVRYRLRCFSSLREKEFCINFLAPQYYDNCRETVFKNDNQADEIAIGGMTAEPSSAIGAPRIREAFLTMECTLESHTDLSGAGINSMIVGRVRHVSVDSNHGSIANICSPNAFMYNVHSPKDAQTGLGETSAVAALSFLREG